MRRLQDGMRRPPGVFRGLTGMEIWSLGALAAWRPFHVSSGASTSQVWHLTDRNLSMNWREFSTGHPVQLGAYLFLVRPHSEHLVVGSQLDDGPIFARPLATGIRERKVVQATLVDWITQVPRLRREPIRWWQLKQGSVISMSTTKHWCN